MFINIYILCVYNIYRLRLKLSITSFSFSNCFAFCYYLITPPM